MSIQRVISPRSRPELHEKTWVALILLLGAALLLVSCSNRRVALVVGNSAYTDPIPPLGNPGSDAEAIGQALQRLNFQVMLARDLDRGSMDLMLEKFVNTAKGADVALFFYAGHGFQIRGENYLVPIDIHGDIVSGSISFDEIMYSLGGAATNTIIFLDACRRNPLLDAFNKKGGDRAIPTATGLESVRDGLAEMHARYGTLIAFSAAPGHVAYEGKGHNSPFTKALLHHIEAPNVDVRTMLTEVRTEVMRGTNDQQVPWDHSSLTGAFYFRRESPMLSW